MKLSDLFSILVMSDKLDVFIGGEHPIFQDTVESLEQSAFYDKHKDYKVGFIYASGTGWISIYLEGK